jgi:hypothetical protein
MEWEQDGDEDGEDGILPQLVVVINWYNEQLQVASNISFESFCNSVNIRNNREERKEECRVKSKEYVSNSAFPCVSGLVNTYPNRGWNPFVSCPVTLLTRCYFDTKLRLEFTLINK